MDLAFIKKLTERIRRNNGDRRPVPKELHRALTRTAKDFCERYRDTPTMTDFIAKVSRPGFEPSPLDMYVLKELMGLNE